MICSFTRLFVVGKLDSALRTLVTKGLSGKEQNHTVRWMVEQLLGVQTDASMPRQVWINLISNALTSTQGKEPAIIEINARGRASKAISHYRWHGGRTCAESEVGKTRGFSFH